MPLLLSHQQQLLLLLIFVSIAASHGDSSDDTYDLSMCLNQTYTCGGMSISYPFYLSEETKDLKGNNSYCGYPGMGILCDDGTPILQLNGTANYTVTVKSIQGTTTNVSLADPEVVGHSCPRVDHNVTLAPGSWLELPDGTVDYIFFYLGCYFPGLVRPSEKGPITCPGFDSGYSAGTLSFVIPDDKVPSGNWSLDCNKVIRVPVLKHGEVDPKDAVWRNQGYAEVLRRGFEVSWEKKPEPCMQCERSNSGRCAYKQTGEFLRCLCTNGRVNVDCQWGTSNAGTLNAGGTHFQSGTFSK